MKILVTGPSGTVGRQVLQQLCAQNRFEITAFDLDNRRVRKNLRPFQNQVNIVYGDITDAIAVEEVCKGKDVVIHLAAVIPPASLDAPALTRRVNVDGTAHVVRALEQHAPNTFLLHASSFSVYGDRVKNPMLRVGDPRAPSPTDFYAQTKVAAEKIVEKATLDWCMFRLSAVAEVGAQRMDKLMFLVPLATCLESTTSDDVARAFVKAIEERAKLRKRIFNIGGGEHFRATYREYIQMHFERYGLGEVMLPDKAFAEKNFHCGYVADSNILNDILHYRSKGMEEYMEQVAASVPPLQRAITKLLRRAVQAYLLRLSEPYRAYQAKDKVRMQDFFEI